MALKNYYAILGVSRDETPAGIRAAYKEAVQRTHPDHAGPEAAAAFHEVVEAHSVLSDPDRRRSYNQSLTTYERGRSERVLPRSVPNDRRPEGFSVEVILTPDEAARGGTLRIGIPVREFCRFCGGTGNDWLFPCTYCAGKGAVSRMQPVQVTIPHSLRLGLTPEVSLGIYNLEVRMRVSNEQIY
jgi:molecular chaperone DnaJ